ncbi:MAG: hypothetical protein AAF940_13235 [Pseudomonadota bacterium]
MAKVFGRLARRQFDSAYTRYDDALKNTKEEPKRLDENLAWISFFTMVLIAAIYFAPEATAKPIAYAMMAVM